MTETLNALLPVHVSRVCKKGQFGQLRGQIGQGSAFYILETMFGCIFPMGEIRLISAKQTFPMFAWDSLRKWGWKGQKIGPYQPSWRFSLTATVQSSTTTFNYGRTSQTSSDQRGHSCF